MRKQFYRLKKGKVRQSWHKINLYNLSRMTTPSTSERTFFQQKWTAKSLTRAYHGEQIRERKWQDMFRPRMPAVVSVSYKKLAESDGSEHAAGRGSGADRPPDERKLSMRPTPYMQMVYFPMERRLDTAIFRALFASSARQARQFVVHGFVKVNGKKMIYPGYLLNPGDMFQVEPERVLFATGARKDQIGFYRRHPERAPGNEQSQTSRERVPAGFRQKLSKEELDELKALRAERRKQEREAHLEGLKEERERRGKEYIEALTAAQKAPGPKELLKLLLERAQALLVNYKDEYKDNLQLDLVRFKKTVDVTLARLNSAKGISTKEASLESKIHDIMERMSHLTPSRRPRSRPIPPPTAPSASSAPDSSPVDSSPDSSSDSSASPTTTTASTTNPSNPTSTDDPPNPSAETEGLPTADAKLLRETLDRILENPPDPSKPYVTPWRPRDYMAAFAFIPRYLEVNHNICAAVYLRHPVARPGLAEVPTPFHRETSELAFTWYLRRR